MKKVSKYYIAWAVMVIIIFALLTTFGFIYKNKSNDYKKLEQNIIEATQKYVDNKFLYPDKNKSIKITIKELQENNFIGILKKGEDECTGYAIVKSSGTAYDYKGYIKCPQYQTKGY